MSTKLRIVYPFIIGESSVETRTEAGNDDITVCSHDNKPSTGLLVLIHT